MLNLLVTADALTWVSICVKALVYATSLVAAGSVLVMVLLRNMPAREVRRLKWRAVACAAAAAVLSLARLPIRASFLTGGTWQGATDPVMLSLVADSPLGFGVLVRLVGLALICLVVMPRPVGRISALVGAIIVAASFVFRGHTLEEPRLVLAALITLHVLGLAFWLGGFAPLYRVAGMKTGRIAGQLAHDFGRIALWGVAGLALAGGAALWLLTGGIGTAIFTPYGQFFAIKLMLFVGVLSFAAWNKFRLTPALLQDHPLSGMALRKSILLEAAFVGAVLVTTAALTTLSAPVLVAQGETVDGPDSMAQLAMNLNGDVSL